MNLSRRVASVERRVARFYAIEPPEPIEITWPDGSGPHDGAPPLPGAPEPPAGADDTWLCSPSCPACLAAEAVRAD